MLHDCILFEAVCCAYWYVLYFAFVLLSGTLRAVLVALFAVHVGIHAIHATVLDMSKYMNESYAIASCALCVHARFYYSNWHLILIFVRFINLCLFCFPRSASV